MSHNTRSVRTLAPEDIRVGDSIIIMDRTHQLINWCNDVTGPTVQSLALMPTKPKLLRVVSVCIPFVAVQRLDRKGAVLDLRQVRVARVSAGFDTVARGLLGPESKTRSR